MTPSALTEKAFAERRRREWEELDELTLVAKRSGVKSLTREKAVRYPPLYRSVCADLAAAQAARYSAPLVEYLLGLTAAAHTVVYGRRLRGHRRDANGEGGLRQAWLVAFPRAVRKHKGAMLLATLLFFVPLALGVAITLREPTLAFRIVPEAMLRPLTEAYTEGLTKGRGPGQDVLMTAFYVYNNIGIALRCFALGIFGGLGSAFYLVQNGLSIGATLGYVASQGAGANIALFIIGHGSLELGAIVLAGGSGLSLGWAIVAPGDVPRLVSQRRRAREILVVVAGAAVMLLMAALIEGFWSASGVPDSVKVTVGATLFVLVVAYIFFAGREEAIGQSGGGQRSVTSPWRRGDQEAGR